MVVGNGIVYIDFSVLFILHAILHLFMPISHVIILYLNVYYY